MNPIVRPIGNDDYPDSTRGIRSPLPFPQAELNFCFTINVRAINPLLNETLTVTALVPRTEELSDTETSDSQEEILPNAYWMITGDEGIIRDAIYGQVLRGFVLRPLRNLEIQNEHPAEYVITTEQCAIKVMERERIDQQQGIAAENPYDEIRAMQYVARYLLSRDVMDDGENDRDVIVRNIRENNILLPFCALIDNQYLYSIMPLCDDDFFEYLISRGRLNENEARFWMKQILKGIQTLQEVGICHRDISLENLLLHDRSCLIMDFGMCCRIPYSNIPNDCSDFIPRGRRGNRLLFRADAPMGKLRYMAPEIYARQPFDGHAVDLWSVAVMLFMMVTGSDAWEVPSRVNNIFTDLTSGQMHRHLAGPVFGLTPEILDLLGKMMFFDPTDRLSLEQIIQHEWMHGEVQGPAERERWAN